MNVRKNTADKDIKTDLVTPLFAGMTNNILLGTKEEEKYVDQLLKDIEKAPRKRKEYLLDAHDPILVRCSTGSTGI